MDHRLANGIAKVAKESSFLNLIILLSSVDLCFLCSGGLFACYWIPLALSLRWLVFEVYRGSFGAEDELEVIDGLGKLGKARADVIDTTKPRCMVSLRIRLIETSKRRSWRDWNCYACSMCMAATWPTKSDLHSHLSTQNNHFLDQRLLQTLSITD